MRRSAISIASRTAARTAAKVHSERWSLWLYEGQKKRAAAGETAALWLPRARYGASRIPRRSATASATVVIQIRRAQVETDRSSTEHRELTNLAGDLHVRTLRRNARALRHHEDLTRAVVNLVHLE